MRPFYCRSAQWATCDAKRQGSVTTLATYLPFLAVSCRFLPLGHLQAGGNQYPKLSAGPALPQVGITPH